MRKYKGVKWMTEKELKKLRRVELLEILIEQRKEIIRLKRQLVKAQEELKNRRIDLEETGSIAEAALKISGIFEAAQRAADDYLYNIKIKAEEPIGGQAESEELDELEKQEMAP
jgi:polyribonucleotide nucleotidyltransferase